MVQTRPLVSFEIPFRESITSHHTHAQHSTWCALVGKLFLRTRAHTLPLQLGVM